MEDILNKYYFLLDNLTDGVYFVNNERKIEYWNEAAEKITGFSKEEVVGKYCYDNILKHVDGCGKELCMNGCPLEETCRDGQIRRVDIFLHHKKGHRVPVVVKAISIMDKNQKIKGAIEIFSTQVDKIFFEKVAELEKLAMTDTLTGVANRLFTNKFLEEKIQIFNINRKKFSVGFIDIDFFKNFNDTYGHNVGDKVLKIVAETILSNLRADDLVGRWGGEEFVVILQNDTLETLEKTLNKLRVLIEKSELRYENEPLSITVSIGGAVVFNGETKDELIKRADKLMYESKELGRNRVSVR